MTGEEWKLFRTQNEKWWKLYKDRAGYRAALRGIPGYWARQWDLMDGDREVHLIPEHQRQLDELRARFAK